MRFFAVFIIALLTWAPLAARADDAALSLAANQAFLAANAKKPGVISLPGGLQYRVLKTGFGVRPSLADLVQINFTGKLINGTVIDGTSPGLPATVAVSGVIRGLSQVLQMMHVGDRWQVVMPTELAYGAKGAGAGRVPADQALEFDLTLVSSIPASAPDAPQPDPFSILSANEYRKAVLTLHP
jgi:FKBP-type peptidyl-prolyl cis-trans isomerase